MQFRFAPAAALAVLGACAPVVEVTPLHPTPRCIMARAVNSVKLFAQRPEGGIAVYGLVASEGTTDALQAAIQNKAADLGCDGVLISGRDAAGTTRGEVATGQLTAHPEFNAERITALCIVMQ